MVSPNIPLSVYEFTQLLLPVMVVHIVLLWLRSRIQIPEDVLKFKYYQLMTTLISALSLFLIVEILKWMGFDEPTFLVYASFALWTYFYFLSCFVAIEYKGFRYLALLIGLLFSGFYFAKGLSVQALKGSFQGQIFKTENVAFTSGDLLHSSYIFICTYLLVTYLILINVAWQKYKKQAQEYDEGLDADSLYKLSWVVPTCVSIIVSLAAAGADIPSLTLLSGFLAGALALSTKDLITNVAAGYYLIWSESIKKNDVISFEDGSYGVVVKITPRCTIIKNRDDINLIVPNTTLFSSKIENWTQEKTEVRLKLDIGVSYEADIGEAEQCLLKAAYSVGNRVLRDPPPRVLVMGAGESAINLQLRFWINDAQNGIRNISSLVYREMLHQLTEAKIEIPFSKMDVTFTPKLEKEEPKLPSP